MKYPWIAVALIAVAVGGTLFRYGSFHPCEWLEQDVMRTSGLPPVVAQAQIRATFMVNGIVEPDAYDCLRHWWRFKADGKLSGES
ncbi:MAG: hypothetical protein V3S40_12995 [Kiloniellales bacterium]